MFGLINFTCRLFAFSECSPTSCWVQFARSPFARCTPPHPPAPGTDSLCTRWSLHPTLLITYKSPVVDYGLNDVSCSLQLDVRVQLFEVIGVDHHVIGLIFAIRIMKEEVQILHFLRVDKDPSPVLRHRAVESFDGVQKHIPGVLCDHLVKA